MIRLGVLSDIHGNLHALRAVLGEMQAKRVDAILFAGDAVGELNYPREVFAALRDAGTMHAVRGNRERYFINLDKQDQRGWTDKQFASLYWNFCALSPEERGWMERWPDRLCLQWDGLPPVMMAHEIERLASPEGADVLYDVGCAGSKAEWFEAGSTEMCAYARQQLGSGRLRETLHAMGNGVFISGHTHVQWHFRDGSTLLVNPGACGMPLDYRPGAPYTLLTGDAGQWTVEECRASYDIAAAVASLKASGLYAAAGAFSMTTIAQLVTARHYWNPLLQEIRALAKARGEVDMPCDNAIWDEATERWLARQGPEFHQMYE